MKSRATGKKGQVAIQRPAGTHDLSITVFQAGDAVPVTYPVHNQRPFCATVAIQEFGRLLDSTDTQERWGSSTEQCVVLVLRAKWEPWDRGVISYDGVAAELAPLLKFVLSNKSAEGAVGSVLSEPDAAYGQLVAHVIWVHDVKAAHGIRDRLLPGDKSAAGHEHQQLVRSMGARDREEDVTPRLARIEQLLRSASESEYTVLYGHLDELGMLTRAEMAARLTPALNRMARTFDVGTYAKKQDVASWVNTQLRPLGLALRCPKTGLPAIIVADLQGGIDDIGRFRLEVRDKGGKRKRTTSSKEWTDLEVIADIPRPEPFAKWTDRAGGSGPHREK